MGESIKIEDIKLLHYVLKRPKMFSIYSIELFYMFFSGYLIGKEQNDLKNYLDDFSQFVKNKYSSDFFEQFTYDRIIRLYSVDDSHSLILLKELIEEFEKSTFNIIP